MKIIQFQPHARTCFALALAFGVTLATSAVAALVQGSQNISGTRHTDQYTAGAEFAPRNGTYGPYDWNYSYTRSFDGAMLKKHLEIQFVFDAGLNYTEAQKAAYKASAEANIEGIWNNKYAIKDNTTGISYPVKVDVTTTGPFNQTVNVKQMQVGTDPPYNMTSWYTSEDTPAAQAHEFGHMLGLYDEYVGGAVNQWPNALLSNDGLMGLGALNANPVMYPRYYQQYLDYMNQLNPGESFSLVPVPEPGTFAAGALLLAILLLEFRKPGGRPAKEPA